MNEIDKLKIEHARYKKALADIQLGVYGREPSAIALEALHPVQRILPPATVENLVAALQVLNDRERRSVLHSIRFFGDRSGFLLAGDSQYATFHSLRQALDIMEKK